MTEFNLSKKKSFISGAYVNKKNRGYVYGEKDVKEFIRRLKEKIKDGRRKPNQRYGICDYCEAVITDYIDKIAGDDLK